MAKKRARKKKAPEIQRRELPGGFWHQIGAVLMIAVSIILVAAWFGQGGVALNSAQDFLLKIIGYTTFLLPLILIYLAVMIFRSDDNRLDPSVWIASFLMLLWFSGVFGIAQHGTSLSHGGYVGTFLNNFMLQLVTGGIAYFIYIVLILITALFMYAETPAALFRRIGALFATSKTDEDKANAKVMRRSQRSQLAEEAVERPSKVNVVNHAEADEKDDQKQGLLTKVTNKAEGNKEDEGQTLAVINTQDWKMPTLDLLARHTNKADPGDPQKVAEIIRETFGEFGIDVTVGDAIVGPSVTQYRVTPPAGVKISRMTSMSEELTSALGVGGSGVVRIAPVPNERRIIGVEVPNLKAATVGLREIMTTKNWQTMASSKTMAFALGRDNDGNAVILDLADMPHLLVAGTTGSGKSVTIHSMLTSLMYHNSPADLRLILIDPKHLEFGLYDEIPHLLTPVVEDVKSTLSVLKWAIDQMEHRLKQMRGYDVQNIADYNALVAAQQQAVATSTEADSSDQNDAEQPQKLPYIIIAFDELQDFIKAKPGGREIEAMLARLTAKARAAGIILVIATQYPKADIITTAIKANIPSRIVLKVVEQTQSRVALDRPGAEKLIGNGDLLYMTRKMPAPRRAQSAFVSNAEIKKIVRFLRKQGEPQYVKEILTQQVQVSGAGASMGGFDGGGSGSNDDHRQAAEIAVQYQKVSTTLLQRKMHIGFGRAASILDDLEEMGVVSPPPGGNKAREVLISSIEEYDERNI